MTVRLETGLITPPYSAIGMNYYEPSAKSDTAVSDICAQTVCFLWFESLPTLHEAATTNLPYHTRLPDVDSIAKPEFTRWTREVLSTTRVSVNVVILAMLFIYRLKIANPNVKGKAGSEYRLLTVALMLGNKFLDDHTYTNKTWAQVTAIDVKEIHLMEVEFLSNMRYQLMVSVEEWHQWLTKINMFLTYQQEQRRSLTFPMQIGLPSPPCMSDKQHFAASMATWPGHFQMTPPVREFRGRKRSLGDEYFPDMYSMLPPHKKIVSSQPSTPNRSTNMLLRSTRSEQPPTIELSPSRHQRQAATVRGMPPITSYSKLSMPAINLTHARQAISVHSNHSAHSNSLSPSYLQVSTQPSLVSSPTTSPISQYSSHSHGAVLNHRSPSSKAMQNRNSPYAPVRPVHRLVGRYQPVLRSSQHDSVCKESLRYSQLTAGGNQSLYNGRVPLSSQNSPYYFQPRQ